jgi:hypothetical protein
MDKAVLLLVWVIVYVLIGVHCDRLGLITHPAYWALYGAFCSMVVNSVIGRIKREVAERGEG